jgi:hypothetical protein
MRRIVGAMIVLVVSSTAAMAGCDLTAADFKSLQLSDSHIADENGVNQLDNRNHALLCSTRRLWREVRATRGKLRARPSYSPYYLSPAEKVVVTPAVDAWIQKNILK